MRARTGARRRESDEGRPEDLREEVDVRTSVKKKLMRKRLSSAGRVEQ